MRKAANVVSWYVQVGLPSGNGSGLIEVQNVRAGSPGFVVTLTNSTAGVAQLGSDEPVVLGQTVTKPIQPGFYYTQAIPFSTQYGLFFDPLAPGTTTVTATGPLNVITTSQAIRTVVITPVMVGGCRFQRTPGSAANLFRASAASGSPVPSGLNVRNFR